MKKFVFSALLGWVAVCAEVAHPVDTVSHWGFRAISAPIIELGLLVEFPGSLSFAQESSLISCARHRLSNQTQSYRGQWQLTPRMGGLFLRASALKSQKEALLTELRELLNGRSLLCADQSEWLEAQRELWSEVQELKQKPEASALFSWLPQFSVSSFSELSQWKWDAYRKMAAQVFDLKAGNHRGWLAAPENTIELDVWNRAVFANSNQSKIKRVRVAHKHSPQRSFVAPPKSEGSPFTMVLVNRIEFKNAHEEAVYRMANAALGMDSESYLSQEIRKKGGAYHITTGFESLHESEGTILWSLSASMIAEQGQAFERQVRQLLGAWAPRSAEHPNAVAWVRAQIEPLRLRFLRSLELESEDLSDWMMRNVESRNWQEVLREIPSVTANEINAALERVWGREPDFSVRDTYKAAGQKPKASAQVETD